MRVFQSVGARLSIALAAVVLGALAIVWVALVPTLQRRLENGRIGQLTAAAQGLEREAAGSGGITSDLVDETARTENARVVYFPAPLGGSGTVSLVPLYDSRQVGTDREIVNDPVALRALQSKPVHGIVSRGGQSYAEVAIGDVTGGVLLVSASLKSVDADVSLVRQRVVWAGLIALAVSLLVGIVSATAFARRVRRLERAADRIASGDFDEPVVDGGRDELGELAQAFDRMRLQLAQLEDARREFIANASHELRTPIFALGGFLELLQDEELDQPTRDEFLATMTEQVERLAKLAGDLLDLSRIDSGRLRPEREPIELETVAEALRDEFRALARQREHPLELEVDGAATALGDGERILQIGRALVDNALLHTPPGTRVTVVARGGTLAVEDDGPGIADEDGDRVFERFTRLEGARASGTGLGLAIARELAELMDGRLVLDSRPGRTVFRLELPLAPFSRENRLGPAAVG